MTTTPQATARQPAAVSPPWPLVWLVAYGFALPASVAGWVASFDLDGTYGPTLAGTPSLWLLLTYAALSLVPDLLLLGGVLGVLLPGVRGRWVERRHGLVPPDRAVLREIETWLREHGAAVEVRANLTRSGRTVRVYPVGLRRARVAVFAPFVKLWRGDRAAAEAMLLHEVAHVRTGDHLLLGIGSPLVGLVNLWLPLVLAGGVLPLVLLFALDYPTASTLSAQLILLVTEVPRLLLVPVVALWVAELAADRHVAGLGRTADLLRALDRHALPPAGRYGRLLVALSHPPSSLRRAAVRRGRWGAAALLALWPLSSFLLLALILVGAVAGWLMTGVDPTTIGGLASSNSAAFLVDNARVWVPAALLLALWPVLGRGWARWWSGTTAAPAGVPAALYPVVALAVVVLMVGALLTLGG